VNGLHFPNESSYAKFNRILILIDISQGGHIAINNYFDSAFTYHMYIDPNVVLY
jgi:hypothetical protein